MPFDRLNTFIERSHVHFVHDLVCEEARRVVEEMDGLDERLKYRHALVDNPEFSRSVLFNRARQRVLDILSNVDDYSLWTSVVSDLKKLFLEWIEVNKFAGSREDSGNGIGLGFYSAISCLNEEVRTLKFVDAVSRGVKDFEGLDKTIEVVDAGCGPIPNGNCGGFCF